MTHLLLAFFLAANTANFNSVPAAIPTQIEPHVSSAAVESLVQHVEELSPKQQLELYLGASTLRDERAARHDVFSVERIQDDPALQRTFAAINTRWLIEKGAKVPTARRLVEEKVMVARNLFFQGLEPSAINVASEIRRIRSMRGQLAATPLIEGRTVVFAASDDKLRDGRPIFGRPATRRFLSSRAERFVFLQDDGPELTRWLRETPDLTFAFEGHGNGKAIKLGGPFKAEHLAEILAQRPADFPAPIIILDTCFAHDFARRVAQALERKHSHAAMPILIVPDEIGQKQLKQVFAASFLRLDVSSGVSAAGALTLDSLITSPTRRITVYAPDTRNVLAQIS